MAETAQRREWEWNGTSRQRGGGRLTVGRELLLLSVLVLRVRQWSIST